jgi:cellobiose-specific phosphotransferase system component IIB
MDDIELTINALTSRESYAKETSSILPLLAPRAEYYLERVDDACSETGTLS